MDDDFRDMLGLLKSTGTEFVVVGGFAMAAHGHPRYTGDLDVFVRATPQNAERLWRALGQFGAPLDDVSPNDFHSPGTGLHLGVPPGRIDILTRISGVSFDEAWTSRIDGELFGEAVPVIGREQFIANKAAAGREKDLLDLKTLQQGED